ncbi:MAG: hypothetical protein ACR652_01970 [Methylocystis sp.]
MIANILIVASLVSPLAFWLAAPRRVAVPVKARGRVQNRSF